MCKASSYLLILLILPTVLPTEGGAQSAAEPISIDAESTDTDLNTGKTILSGNVVIQRGHLEIRADRAVSTSGQTRVERLELTGDPVRWRDLLDSGEAIDGQARKVIYDVTTRTVTLLDQAVIVHPRGRVNGNELIYDLDTERLTGKRADGENIRWLIEPEALEGAGAEADEPGDDEPAS